MSNLTNIINVLENEKKRRDAMKGINEFTEYIMSDESGKSFKQARIHREMQEVIDNNRKSVILLPRGHGKTSQIIARVLYETCKNRNIKIKIVCATEGFAKKRVMAIREHLNRNERLRELFPDIMEIGDTKDWSKTSITLNRDIIDKDPTVEAAGVLASGVGGRANLLIFDDVINLRNSILQPGLKEQVKQAFKEVWIPLLMPDGKFIYIATPWTTDDLTSDLEKNPKFALYKRAIDDALTPIWEEVWTREALVNELDEIGITAFNRSYKLKPLSSTDNTFPLHVLTTKVFTSMDIVKQKDWIIVGGVDLGMSSSSKSYSVIITVGIDLKSKVRYVLNIRRGKWNSPDVAKIIGNEYNIYRHSKIYVESNVYQNALLHWMKSSGTKGVPVVPIETNVSDKYIRILASNLSVEMNNYLWKIPVKIDHETDCKCEWCTLKKELIAYPFGTLSDTVSALCIAATAINDTVIKEEDIKVESWNAPEKKEKVKEKEVKEKKEENEFESESIS